MSGPLYLITGAGGGTAGVSRLVIAQLRAAVNGSAHWCTVTTTAPSPCVRWAPRSSSVT